MTSKKDEGKAPSEARSFVSGILLAAGESKRLDGTKLFLLFGGSTILEAALDNMLAAELDEVIVVVGHRSDELIRLIGRRAVKIAVNNDYRLGMSTSIVRGMDILDSRASGVMLALADQPQIGSALLNRLISEFRSDSRGIVVPAFEGKRGHPVIFSIGYRNELKKLKGDTGAREIVSRHSADVRELAVSSGAILMDIDTPADYRCLPASPKTEKSRRFD